ncbi:MAG: UDP-N-acetylmuramoylalanyl-D-glutamyl-2, 6-diaminopimelate--D-alanyl-D-alanine ligase [Firmicutes bacterium HGW-Firmicutes-16]|nr:MAG: UDP-N-acetylmuramoylalanyl-D-glutamyl-2, 6-diaminopimelate--D-alanyl-D-alanine ligase [Firmicutes bacterium HGW-Firmicutes-16]
MKNLTIENIISAVNGEYFGDASLLKEEISSVTTDSRAVTRDCLFAAIKGENSDGHDYIGTALDTGALCAIGERCPENDKFPMIIVKNTITALGELAAFYRRQFDIPVLGITGSVGKTTAKEMISAVLSRRFRVHKTAKNLNNDLGVPLTLFGLNESHEFAVIEMGISHFGEMKRLAEIVHPNMALYTTIGFAHLEFLGDFDGVLKAKTEMLEYLPENGIVFINGDDETLRKLTCKQKICLYGMSHDCEVTAENVRLLGTDGMELEIVSGARRIPCKINSFGVHMVTAALGAAAVGLQMGLTDDEISAGIASYVPVGSRSGIIDTGKITIIDDCYNANPTSVAAAVDSLSLLEGRRVCILGDMGELGETASKLHFETGAHAAEKGIDLVIACGELSSSTAEGASSEGDSSVVYFNSKEKFFAELPRLIEKGDSVLVKASHSQRFEEIVEALKTL